MVSFVQSDVSYLRLLSILLDNKAILRFCTNDKVQHIVSNRQGPGRAQGPGMQPVRMEAVLAMNQDHGFDFDFDVEIFFNDAMPAQLY